MDINVLYLIALTGVGLTVARRIHNEDTHAGAGVAVLTMIAIIVYITK